MVNMTGELLMDYWWLKSKLMGLLLSVGMWLDLMLWVEQLLGLKLMVEMWLELQ